LVFLDNAKLESQFFLSCLRDLEQLRVTAAFTGTLELGERFIFLDFVMTLKRHGVAHLKDFASFVDGGKQLDRIPQNLLDSLDWDSVLRDGNRWFDRIVSAMRHKDRGIRTKELATIEAEAKKVRKELFESGGLGKVLDNLEEAK